jgi:hypothetical protein
VGLRVMNWSQEHAWTYKLLVDKFNCPFRFKNNVFSTREKFIVTEQIFFTSFKREEALWSKKRKFARKVLITTKKVRKMLSTSESDSSLWTEWLSSALRSLILSVYITVHTDKVKHSLGLNPWH